MTSLKEWLRLASRRIRRRLPELSGTTEGYINQIANGHANASAEMAGRLAKSCNRLKLEYKEDLPHVERGELSNTCKFCPYYVKYCEGKDAK